MNLAFAVAATFSGITGLIHVFVGGPWIARPLLQARMHPVPKYTHYYCWHLVSLTLLAMTCCFGYAAAHPSHGADLALAMLLLSTSFATWSLALVLRTGRGWLELPQWMLFAVVSFVAALGFIR